MLLVVDRGAHRLCERGRRQQWGNQHHAAEVTDGELVAQRANRGGIRVVQVTPVDVNRWPAAIAPSRVPTIAATT